MVTLYVWQVFLVLVNLTAVDGERQAFEQHSSLLQLGVAVGEQTHRAALGYSHPGWRETHTYYFFILLIGWKACIMQKLPTPIEASL